MYFSLIAALGALSRYDNATKLEVLLALIELEPLRRLFVAYSYLRTMVSFGLRSITMFFLRIE